MQQEHADREDDQAQPEQAGDVLHHREPDPPDHDPHTEGRDGDPQLRSDVAGQLQRQGDAADLGGDGHQVDEEGRAEVGRCGPRAEAFPDDLEGGPPADRRDPAGHLRVEADPEHADRHHPGQRQTEPGADDGVGDQIADVEEAADGGEDAERDREDLLHQW